MYKSVHQARLFLKGAVFPAPAHIDRHIDGRMQAPRLAPRRAVYTSVHELVESAKQREKQLGLRGDKASQSSLRGTRRDWHGWTEEAPREYSSRSGDS